MWFYPLCYLFIPFWPPCQRYFPFLLCTSFDSLWSSEGSDKKGDLGLIPFLWLDCYSSKKRSRPPNKECSLAAKRAANKKPQTPWQIEGWPGHGSLSGEGSQVITTIIISSSHLCREVHLSLLKTSDISLKLKWTLQRYFDICVIMNVLMWQSYITWAHRKSLSQCPYFVLDTSVNEHSRGTTGGFLVRLGPPRVIPILLVVVLEKKCDHLMGHTYNLWECYFLVTSDATYHIVKVRV